MSEYGFEWNYGADVSHPIAIRVVQELGHRVSDMVLDVVPYGFRKYLNPDSKWVDSNQFLVNKLEKCCRNFRNEPEVFTRRMCAAHRFVAMYTPAYEVEMKAYFRARYP
jgi:hypothetical protein